MTDGWAGTWGPFQALDHRFELRSTSSELGTYLGDAYGALRVDGPCDTWYGIDHLGRFGTEPSVLVDGTRAYGSPEPSVLLPWLVWRINQDAAAAAVDLVVHASAVRVGDGIALFVGTSGVGKSTLAAMLTMGGAEYVTDEAVAVTAEGAVRPYPKPLSLSAASLTAVGVAQASLPPGFERATTEHLVDPRRLGRVASSAGRIRALVVLERDTVAAAPHADVVSRAEGIASVAAHLLRPSPADPAALRTLGRAAVDAVCVRLALGPPRASAALVHDLLLTTMRGG